MQESFNEASLIEPMPVTGISKIETFEKFEKEIEELVDSWKASDPDIDKEEIDRRIRECMMSQLLKDGREARPDMCFPNHLPEDALDSKSFERYASQLSELRSMPSPEDDAIMQEIQAEAPQRSQNIFRNYHILKSFMAIHGSTLQYRWTRNRNKEKRSKLLLEAWPGMAPRHRPDFQAIKKGCHEDQHKYACLMPYINLEDLSSPQNLILLLQSRSRYDPEVFAFSDGHPLQLATHAGVITPQRCYGYTMYLTDQKTEEMYGKLAKWNDHPESVYTTFMERRFFPSAGLLVLEIQDKLLSFLVKCAQLLLPDISLTFENLQLPQSPERQASNLDADIDSGDLNPADIAEWKDMMQANTEAPYRVPRPIELGQLQRLAIARRDEAEDEMWLLRENPASFQEAVQECYRLHCEIWRGTDPCQNPSRARIKEGISLQEAHRKVVHDACKYLILWDILLQGVNDLERLKATLGEQVSPTAILPSLYREALTNFMMIQQALFMQSCKDLVCTAALSQPLKQYHHWSGDGFRDLFVVRLDLATNPPVLDLIYDLVDKPRNNSMEVMNILDEIKDSCETMFRKER